MNKTFRQLANRLLVANKAFFLAIILFIIASFLSEYFLVGANILDLIRQISIGCIIAIGFTFVIGLAEIDLSVGSVAGLIGVVMALLMRDAQLPVYLVIIIGFATGLACGTINALVISALELPAFVVTLAGMSVYRGLAYILSNMKPINPLPDAFNNIGAGNWGPIPIPIYILVLVIVIAYFIAERTKIGRYVIAIGGNREAARANGISIFKTRLRVYWMMGICATLVAIIITGRTGSGQPNGGINMELDAIAAVVMGGSSLFGGKMNIIGTVFGAAIIGITVNMLNLLSIESTYQIMVKGVLILLALVLDALSTKLYANMRKKQKIAALSQETAS